MSHKSHSKRSESDSYSKTSITLLAVDKTPEWCHSYMLVLKPNGKVRLGLDLARLNQALKRHVHRGPILNDILPKLNNDNFFLLNMQVLVITA